MNIIQWDKISRKKVRERIKIRVLLILIIITILLINMINIKIKEVSYQIENHSKLLENYALKDIECKKISKNLFIEEYRLVSFSSGKHKEEFIIETKDLKKIFDIERNTFFEYHLAEISFNEKNKYEIIFVMEYR